MNFKYNLIFCLLFFLSCQSKEVQEKTDESLLLIDEIYGSYINVNDSNDSLILLETNKYKNVIYTDSHVVNNTIGEYNIVRTNNDRNSFSFCYLRKYNEQNKIQTCSDIVKSNGKIQLSYETKLYEK